MAKISELKEIIVSLKVELLKSKLPDSCCPYRYFGNPTNKEIDCNEIDCSNCKRIYFEDYRSEIKKEVRKL